MVSELILIKNRSEIIIHVKEETCGVKLMRDAFFSAPVVVQPQCTVDADCASKLACFSGMCRNPCIETKPCAANAACTVVDTLPLRTMACNCLPGYVGDADVECKPGMFSWY